VESFWDVDKRAGARMIQRRKGRVGFFHARVRWTNLVRCPDDGFALPPELVEDPRPDLFRLFADALGVGDTAGGCSECVFAVHQPRPLIVRL